MYLEQYAQLNGPGRMTSGVKMPLHSGHWPMRSNAEERAIERPAHCTANRIRFLVPMFSTGEGRRLHSSAHRKMFFLRVDPRSGDCDAGTNCEATLPVKPLNF